MAMSRMTRKFEILNYLNLILIYILLQGRTKLFPLFVKIAPTNDLPIYFVFTTQQAQVQITECLDEI